MDSATGWDSFNKHRVQYSLLILLFFSAIRPLTNGFDISIQEPFNIVDFTCWTRLDNFFNDVKWCWFNFSFVLRCGQQYIMNSLSTSLNILRKSCSQQCWIRLTKAYDKNFKLSYWLIRELSGMWRKNNFFLLTVFAILVTVIIRDTEWDTLFG